jgi:hypothetical protein
MSFMERLLDDPARVARLKRWSYIALVVVAATEIILPRIFHEGEAHFLIENFPAWGSLYGLLSCVAIIIVSKLIGKLWLMRREDYYDD